MLALDGRLTASVEGGLLELGQVLDALVQGMGDGRGSDPALVAVQGFRLRLLLDLRLLEGHDQER